MAKYLRRDPVSESRTNFNTLSTRFWSRNYDNLSWVLLTNPDIYYSCCGGLTFYITGLGTRKKVFISYMIQKKVLTFNTLHNIGTLRTLANLRKLAKRNNFKHILMV